MKILGVACISKSHRKNSKDRLVAIIKTSKDIRWFYQSSGTGGKANQGDWIPFISVSDTWIQKKEYNKQPIDKMDIKIAKWLSNMNLCPTIKFNRTIGWSILLNKWIQNVSST